jgi:hypothetical protein
MTKTFHTTPEGEHLKGTKWRVRDLDAPTLAAYKVWKRRRHHEAQRKINRGYKTSEFGQFSAKKLNLEEDIDIYLLDQMLRFADASRLPWHGYMRLGNGGFWKSRRHSA